MKPLVLTWSIVFLALLSSCSDDDSATDDGKNGGGTGDGGIPPVADLRFSFFATSRGSGELGGNYGGLEGADAFCQELAAAAGGGTRTWRAYLCTSAVDARDRIGSGPWYNENGDKVAESADSLHQSGISNDEPQHILDEYGEPVPNLQHDIVTGCEADGTVREDATCQDWTSASPDDVAYVGHSEVPDPPFDTVTSWNSAHLSQGCDEAGLEARLGAGRIYCFATDE